MGSEKLTAEERKELRAYAEADSLDRFGVSAWVLRLLDEHASLERELAELREAVTSFLDAMDDADTTVGNASDARALNELAAKLRALLPAASEPAKEPTAQAHVFGVGDEVRCTGTRLSNPPYTVTAHGLVMEPKKNGGVRVDFGDRYGNDWLVHPRDLVLVRKAKEPSDG